MRAVKTRSSSKRTRPDALIFKKGRALLAPSPVSLREPPSPASAGEGFNAKLLPQERQQQDDRDRHANQPEQNSASHVRLLRSDKYDPNSASLLRFPQTARNFISELRFSRRPEV